MKDRYLTLYKPYWVSWIMGYPKIKIGKTLKIFVNKDGHNYDKRRKIIKKLMKQKPKGYKGIEGDVKMYDKKRIY